MIRSALQFLKRIFASSGGTHKPVWSRGIKRADRMLQHLADRQQLPGMAVSVFIEGKAVLQKGYGFADLEERRPPNPITTRFRIASISKPIAATALLHMVSEGTIDLDASFYDYVPYFPKKANDFTIRQLAGHTAGIRGYRGKEYGLNKPYSIRESLQIFQDDPLLFKPDTDYLYNSYDWVMVSLAIQEVSGIPFSEYVRQNVLLPLEMVHTQPETPELEPESLATFYSPGGNGFRKAMPVNNNYKLAGGGYLSTAEDVCRLGCAYLEGVIGTPALRSKFLENRYVNGKPTWYGLGWEVSKDKEGRSYYGHTGHNVGAYSIFRVYPKAGMVCSFLVNCTDPGIGPTLETVIGTLLKSADY